MLSRGRTMLRKEELDAQEGRGNNKTQI